MNDLKRLREAEDEIVDELFSKMQIGSDQVTEILKKHGVTGDPEELQNSYRRRVGQRLLSGLRDEEGQQEVLCVGGKDYVVVECCNDPETLRRIRKQVEAQIQGLDNSAEKVRGRLRTLRPLVERSRRRRRGGDLDG